MSLICCQVRLIRAIFPIRHFHNIAFLRQIDLVSGTREVNLDEYKAIFIDRNPKYFSHILDYLRVAGTSDLNFDLPKNEDILKKLIKEADFYRLEGLKDILNTHISIQHQQPQQHGQQGQQPTFVNVPLFESLVLTPELSKDLIKLCKFPHNQKWKLVYRASVHGFKGIFFFFFIFTDHLKQKAQSIQINEKQKIFTPDAMAWPKH